MRNRLEQFYGMMQLGRYEEGESFITPDTRDNYRNTRKNAFLAFDISRITFEPGPSPKKADIVVRLNIFTPPAVAPVPTEITNTWVLENDVWMMQAPKVKVVTLQDLTKGAKGFPHPTVLPQDLKFDKTTASFGTRNRGDKVIVKFTFKNVADHPVTITVDTYCECLVVKGLKKEYKPQEVGEFAVEFDTDEFLDEYGQTIIARTAGGADTRLLITGYLPRFSGKYAEKPTRPLTLASALRQATDTLNAAGVTAPQLTAEVLLMHATRRDRAGLRAHPERDLTDVERIHFARYIHERLSGVPTQYITGHQEFWGLDIRVTPEVLIPRPETEHLVERALAIASLLDPKRRAPLRIVDCGTGSGCIALALASEFAAQASADKPTTTPSIIATDISASALATAAKNAATLGLRVSLARADLLTCFADASLDLVVANPPYVSLTDAPSLAREVREHEPHLALFAASEGLAIYQRLIPDAARVLRCDGWLAVELGYNMAERVHDLFTAPAWDQATVGSDPDLAGITRVMYAQRCSRR